MTRKNFPKPETEPEKQEKKDGWLLNADGTRIMFGLHDFVCRPTDIETVHLRLDGLPEPDRNRPVPRPAVLAQVSLTPDQARRLATDLATAALIALEGPDAAGATPSGGRPVPESHN